MADSRPTHAADPRKRRIRHAMWFLVLALLLLGLAIVSLGVATPDWEPDGSRSAYAAWMRALITVALVGGTVLVPVSVRALVLAFASVRVLSIVLSLAIGMAGLVVVPLEVWLVLTVTAAKEPGARERLEQQGDWDWD